MSSSSSRVVRHLFAGAAAGLLLIPTAEVRAGAGWVCTDALGLWHTPGCWSGGVVPGSADLTALDGDVTVVLAGLPAHVKALGLWGAGTVGTRLQIATDLTVDDVERLGSEFSRTYIDQLGGLHRVGAKLEVGYLFNSRSLYTLSGGSLQAKALNVGSLGSGNFVQQGGSTTVSGALTVAASSYATGRYELYAGSITAGREIVGNAGPARFLQFGGANKAGDRLAAARNKFDHLDQGDAYVVTSSLVLNQFTNSYNPEAIYQLFGGALSAPFEYIAVAGRARFEQRGGTNAVDFALSLGVNSGSTGRYELIDGRLDTGGTTVGVYGQGVFEQSGGTHTITNGSLTVGAHGSGSYALHGGNLSTHDEVIGGEGQGTFAQDGGTHQVHGLLTVGVNTGHFELKGGSLDGDVANRGDFTQAGGGYSGHFTNDHSLVRSGGTFAGALSNRGSVLVTGTTQTEAVVTNEAAGRVTLDHANATFVGSVTNYGTFANTGGRANFAGGYTEHGHYASDPAVNTFTTLAVGADGYVTAEAGDEFHVSAAFDNQSTLGTLWDTDEAALVLDGTDTIRFSLAGADLAAAGWRDNFAWGSLDLGAATLQLADANAEPGGALYARGVIGATIFRNTVMNVVGNGFSIYYDPTLAANDYLLGRHWFLLDGGFLAPAQVPLPPAIGLFALSVLGLLRLATRRPV